MIFYSSVAFSFNLINFKGTFLDYVPTKKWLIRKAENDDKMEIQETYYFKKVRFLSIICSVNIFMFLLKFIEAESKWISSERSSSMFKVN